MKRGYQNKKISGDIPAEAADMLIKGCTDIKTGIQNTDAIIMEMHLKGYRNSVYIEYTRQVFTIKELDIRITFDKNIGALFGNYGINEDMPAPVPVFFNDETVFEVKYKDVFPDWLQKAIYRIAPSEYSISKYAESLNYILG